MKDEDQRVLIANSEGLFTEDRRIRSRIAISSIASNGIDNQNLEQDLQGHLWDLSF